MTYDSNESEWAPEHSVRQIYKSTNAQIFEHYESAKILL